MSARFGRVITAMVTPFKADLGVDYDAARKLARFLLEHGSDGLVVSGTTGESATLSADEKIELFRVVKQEVGSDGVVVAGVGSNDTAVTVSLAERAEATGVDGCMVVTPYYNRPPQRGLLKHFSKVAEKTDLPIILYNVPSRTAQRLEADTVIALAEIKNIVALKDAGGNFEEAARVVEGTPSDFELLSGDDSATLPLLSLGATGVVSVASHIVGDRLQKMIGHALLGEVGQAQKVHVGLLPIFKALFEVTNPILVKAALSIIGVDVGGLRLPLVEASTDEKQRLKTVLDQHGVVGSTGERL